MPWPHFHALFSQCFTVHIAIAGKVQLEVSAAPDRDEAQIFHFERAIDPRTATPTWRTRVPIGMIVEGYEHEWIGHAPHPKRGQMMEISGSKQRELRHAM